MLTSYSSRFALCGLLLATSIGALSACSKPAADQAGASVESAAAEASSAVSDVVTPDTPQVFAAKAANANMFEIETSKLAAKSANPDVKAFADMIIKDHTKAGVSFKAALAASADKTITVPKTLDVDAQAKLDELKALKGEEFDKKYISLQKDAHADAIKAFEGYAKDGTDAALKTFASETLPALQTHKDLVDKL